MKFRYIITNTYEGGLQGTNDLIVANQLAASEDFYVYDTEAGVWIASDLTLVELTEFVVEPEHD